MENGLASTGLATISFRIATEPEFIQNLRRWIETRRLDSGQAISEEEAAALTSLLDQGSPVTQQAYAPEPEPGLLETWYL